ncbi:MAG: Polyribonucleotide nucleotidyltransferase [Candidatus Woesebacteria bacterium GW2011_GWC2_47_16]|uniref:Polyribonucleotide nucleotidyltransferase n=2 Tax=Candidatus Woeseibacteriota TaxID=1752722 RepID=A0A0G1S200_9BACT|nr:MAG: Polyribonucleotide nucleotidyltransferase [Candidatus Woesebacteria bacterium GW2011_GWC2_47_16]
MKKVEKTIELGGRKLTLKTGVLAEQAAGSVLASYGETVVLATVATAKLPQDLGYFPLTVEYQERLYAGGRIKGSRWVKREGRPSDDEILTARLIDRSLRPLFHQNYKKDVQIIITVLSVDIENDPTILSAIAASAAVAISPIPWKGPVASLRVGKKNGTYFANPLDSEMAFSEMDLVVSSTKDAVIMIEAAAKEVSEEAVMGGIEFAQVEAKKILGAIEELTKEVGMEKEPTPEDAVSTEIKTKVKKLIGDKVEGLIKGMAAHEGGLTELDEVKKAVIAELSEEDPAVLNAAVEKLVKEAAREMTLKGKRVDGRAIDEIRALSAQVGILPRTHGSAIFQRGQTQVLSVTTLGAPSLEQLIESAEGEESKRYIHHYSMPPYATGQTGRVGYPSRREIGHGALAEKALEPVIPASEVFPYTIRVVSEVTSSNGSTSMASVCGSTLSLMDAGVPVVRAVSGIAMGIVLEDAKKHVILSDIMGMEDYMIGDMDFKVAGTETGITALQLDVKTLNLTKDILEKALSQAKEGRAKILKMLVETLSEPRAKVSIHAPKIKVVKIPPEKIGEIIGPGGKMIRKIIAETTAQVEVEDDGSVNISGTTEEAVNAAVERIEGLTKEVVAGEIYEGEVKRIQPFGAFVEILPGKDGLVHVSDMKEEFVSDPNEIVKIGDKVQVRVKEIDDLGRINLSMLLDPSKDKPRGERREGGGGGGARRPFPRRDFGPRRPSGPHFPTSRFVDSKKKDFGR